MEQKKLHRALEEHAEMGPRARKLLCRTLNTWPLAMCTCTVLAPWSQTGKLNASLRRRSSFQVACSEVIEQSIKTSPEGKRSGEKKRKRQRRICMHVCLRDASSDSRRTVRGALKNSHVGLTPRGIRRDPPIHQHPADTHTLTTIWIQSDQPMQSNTKARSFAQKESPSFGNVGEFKISTSSHQHQTLIAALSSFAQLTNYQNWIGY